MIKYRFKHTGEIVEVASSEELVIHMNNTATYSSHNPRAYMLDYSKRSVLQRNVDIRATDYDSFVQDLIEVGDITIDQFS
jgi:hypothetical protein